MDILIVSGFLGAGKTTFIKELVKRGGREVAVLENDFAKGGIDAARIQDDQVNIWEMTEGCICCSTKGDFALSVLTIANSVDPEILVIEPTGAAFLGNLLKNLSQIEYERIRILPPVTVVDGAAFPFLTGDYRKLFEDQVRFASRIVVTKMENSPEEERQEMTKRLQKMNQEAEITVNPYGLSDEMWWKNLAGQKEAACLFPDDSNDMEPSLPDLEQLTLSGVTLPGIGCLISALEQMIRGKYGDVVRAKGIVRLSGDSNVCCEFDMASGMYSVRFICDEMPDADADETNGRSVKENGCKAVFIGRNLKRQKIRAGFFAGAEKIKVRGRRGAV